MISFFAAALFVGSGIVTAAAAPLAEDGAYTLLFTLAASTAIPLGLFGYLVQCHYLERVFQLPLDYFTTPIKTASANPA